MNFGKDKSPQGFIDPDIMNLLKILNKNESLETTSSCSGRITLMRGAKKGFTEWVYKTHDLASSESIFQEIQKLQDDETLRFFLNN